MEEKLQSVQRNGLEIESQRFPPDSGKHAVRSKNESAGESRVNPYARSWTVDQKQFQDPSAWLLERP